MNPIRLARAALMGSAAVLVAAHSPVWAGDAANAASLANPDHFVSNDGAFLYRAVCQGCHMSAGQGAQGAGRYPALANNPHLVAPLYPAVMVVNGSKAMPPLGKMLDDEQVAAVVNYVRTHFGNHYTDVLHPDEVKKVRK